MIELLGKAPRVDDIDVSAARPVWPLLLLTVLLAPFAAVADVSATAPVCKGSQGYAEAFAGRRTFLWPPDMAHRRAAGVLAEYNPTSQINLTIARP